MPGEPDDSFALMSDLALVARPGYASAVEPLDHPHFTIFPGEAVEVMECLPLPAH